MSAKKSTTILITAVLASIVGAAFVFIVLSGNHYTSTESFCGTSCHSMKAYIAESSNYKNSSHRKNTAGIQASCKDCHLPRELVAETVAHITSGTKDMYSSIVNDFSNPDVWKNKRVVLAENVRNEMMHNDSKNCRYCHDTSTMNSDRERINRRHELAETNGVSCIGCHYNLVHDPIPPSEAFLRANTLQPSH